MAVISVTITESAEQVVSGIPKTVSISTNIPATIFYTLDGSDPTLFSSIYTGPLHLPFDTLQVILKVLASNGVDSSPIITETYITDINQNARLPHSATDAQAGALIPPLYPFGTPPLQPQGVFLNPAEAGVTVNNPALPSTPTGFDGEHNPTGQTNAPFNVENYQIQYSTTDSLGQTGPGVGTLPAYVKFADPLPIPDTTEQFTNTFDPKAFVIFQDFSKENPDDPAQINRQYFTLEDPEKTRDGNHYFNSGLDAPPVSGSFLRSHFNPRDNTITYYYRDNWTNKWIISKTPYKPAGGFDGNLANMAVSNKPGAGFVFQWLPFTRRVLF